MSDHLVRHHQDEDEFHWPALAARVPEAVTLLDVLESEHIRMDPLLEAVRDQGRPASERAADLRWLTHLVIAHLDEEDRAIVPLLEEHITAQEQSDSMQRSRAKIPTADELQVLAMMLAAATEDGQHRMLDPLPPEVTDAWRTVAAPGLEAVHEELVAATRTAAARRPVLEPDPPLRRS